MLAMLASSTTISCAIEIRTRAHVRLSSRWGGVTAPGGGVVLVVSVMGFLRQGSGTSGADGYDSGSGGGRPGRAVEGGGEDDLVEHATDQLGGHGLAEE